MTVTEIRPSNSREFDRETPQLGEVAPREPIYMVPVNEWLPWANRAAGFAAGSWIGAITTLLLHSPLLRWAVASAIAATLLFAFALAGHELRQRHPKTFKRAE